MLTELAPYRETGHQILIEALERRGNVAEALLAYERLRVLLREELGIAPSPTLQAVHQRLLQNTAES
jgi:SARP family transcriptional regulator, regulator of embCAB operon